MINELKVGPQTLSDGAQPTARANKDGSLVVTSSHALYHESSYRGNIFGAGNQGAQAVSVALATTYTGLLLYNPLGSGKILVPIRIKYALSVAPAAIATLGIIQGVQSTAPTGLTALTVRSSRVGDSTTGAGQAYSAATIATPIWAMQLWDGFTAAALPSPTQPEDLSGIFQILPGGFIAIGALTAVSGLGSVYWEEIPA